MFSIMVKNIVKKQNKKKNNQSRRVNLYFKEKHWRTNSHSYGFPDVSAALASDSINGQTEREAVRQRWCSVSSLQRRQLWNLCVHWSGRRRQLKWQGDSRQSLNMSRTTTFDLEEPAEIQECSLLCLLCLSFQPHFSPYFLASIIFALFFV